MPKRTDLQSILMIGAGPIIIGQACEFDYAGVQACRALKEEGYRVVLVNSNPATIMTDPDFADVTYIEPIRWQVVEKIIHEQRPDAILPTMGGQTALNCALDLHRHGVLQAYQVEMIGATRAAIDKAEDRDLFRRAMQRIGLDTVQGSIAQSLEQAGRVLEQVGFPAIIRPSFTLGGTGGGIAYNLDEFNQICSRGLDASPTGELLIEQSIAGWKEYEMEVVRDRADNCIIICSIENLDPMGVHTGDSITVAPAQTLTDKEYQRMRDASIAVLREIGVDTGGSNVQFAVNPDNGDMVVIEMNPRVSRSSALASKATGFPIAKVAAKLAVGFTLDELSNDITAGATPASFEPTIDYVVTKIPRFDFVKFPQADATLTTQMKSVGEVMAIGRTFQASLHKALCSLEIGADGLAAVEPEVPTGPIEPTGPDWSDEFLARLRTPSAERIWHLAAALRQGMDVEQAFAVCKIDPWFIAEIQQLVLLEQDIQNSVLAQVDAERMRGWKQRGFSDLRLAALLGGSADAVRARRTALSVQAVFKRVDSCAAEFDTATAYLYSCYDRECEAAPTDKKKILILGGGPNRIGQGIEFDYCCVHASMALRDRGYETIMVNCNPETVSTDYDISDRLYFEPLTLESVLEIVRVEQPTGVIVQYGGQTPLKLARALAQAGVPIIGTSPESIHRAEDRGFFQQLLAGLALRQPPNRIVMEAADAFAAAAEIGYPLVVRPSYVLGGRAMEVVYNAEDLHTYMHSAVRVSFDSPVLLDRFLSDAVEVDVDAVCDGEQVVIGGILEHIEEAGVHSGDSACSLPPFGLSAAVQDELRRQTRALALALDVVGLVNVQFAIKQGEVYVLEVNPRAARTVPFVSKATGRQLAKVAALCMVGVSLRQQGVAEQPSPPYYAVKEAVFPFDKFPGVDTVLGPEMKSTGEVMGIGRSFGEAFDKAQQAAGASIAASGNLFVSLKTDDQADGVEVMRYFFTHGFTLYATEGTCAALQAAGMSAIRVNKVKQGRPHAVDMIKNGQFDLIVNTTIGKQSLKDSYTIRRQALMHKVTYFTTLAAARAAMEAHRCAGEISINALQCLHGQLELST